VTGEAHAPIVPPTAQPQSANSLAKIPCDKLSQGILGGPECEDSREGFG
jgi:hypothetical protein